MAGLSMQMRSSGMTQSQFLGDKSVLLRCTRYSRRCSTMVRRACRVHAKIREIIMPVLSSTMTEGKITSWLKSEGEEVAKNEDVVVVESDKADMNVPSSYPGYIAAILVSEGEVAPVKAVIGVMADTEEEIEEAKAKYAAGTATEAPVAAAAAEVTQEAVSAAASPPPAPLSAPVQVPVSPKVSVSEHPASEGGSRIVATPYAKKLAKELGVDLYTVAGSGPLGRIVAADIERNVGTTDAAAAASVVVPSSSSSVAAAAAAVPAAATIIPEASTPFTGMQAAVSRNMVESLSVPVFRVGYTVTTDALDALYKKIKSKGVTMSALLAKAAALALVQHPVINASCKDGNSFAYNSRINVAVAVAIDGGLITPVLQDADKLDIYSLSRKWKELVDKARAKQLQPQEYSTGTFTMSNLGMFGVDRFDAILPPGTGAIMAVGSSRPTVVATNDGLLGLKNQMQVNVTADHRIIYGADLAAFLQTFAKIVEDPRDITL